MSQYGEPWFLEAGTNPPHGPDVEWWVSVRNAARGLVIYDAWMASEDKRHPAELAQWERVVACVNFLAGVPTEDLQKCMDSGWQYDDVMKLANKIFGLYPPRRTP